MRRPTLLAALASIAVESGARLRGFSSLSPRELERVTGLSRAAARLARVREWDEPLLIEDPAAVGLVAAAARRRGLRLSQGSRFYHLTGASDKGWAFRLLLGLLASEGRRYATVGLGDCGNDLPMLEAVDRPILIPRAAGVDAVLAARLPRVERAPAPGLAGWNAAVLAVLGDARLPDGARGRRPGSRC